MSYRDTYGNSYSDDTMQDRFLQKLYGCTTGRLVVKVISQPCLSAAAGWFLSTPVSKAAIPGFIKSHRIPMEEYLPAVYKSYNDFFTRRIRPDARPLPKNPDILISPCDGRVSVYPISEKQIFHIKQTPYTIASLLADERLAKRYAGGYCFLIRLTVDNYHHYCYIDDGVKSTNRRIPGILHTVNPAACDVYPVYKENTREYTLIKSRHFGTLLQMEVGAMIVGKIVNLHGKATVTRGQEKGHFAFGGSTVIVLAEKNRILPASHLVKNTEEGYETLIKMGEPLGEKTDS